MQADISGLEQLVADGRYRDAERAVRERIKRFPAVADYRFILAAILAAIGHRDAALDSLEEAVRLGYPGDDGSLSAQFGALAGDARYADLRRRIDEASASAPVDVADAPASAVERQTALVGEANTVWDPRAGVLRVAVRFNDDGPGKGVMPTASIDTEQARWLNRLYHTRRAAGNYGDLYDNRDRDHSTLRRENYPQLTFVEYSDEAKKARVDYGVNPGLQFNAITVGNSSTAVTGGVFWRSQPRLALTSRDGPQRMFEEYSGNHIYIYPEHRDYDPEQGDVFPANTPYILISQGSSGSDKPFIRAVVSILAAFKPEVKAFLKDRNLVMPTVQMVFRRSLRTVFGNADYLSAAAHPTVFSAKAIDLHKMIALAGGLDVADIPPMVRLAVVEETGANPGLDFFGGNGVRLFDTPGAIARIGRTTSYRHRMRISAEATEDPNNRDLTFHWIVLRGDRERIRIEPLNGTASLADIDIPWHERASVPGQGDVESNRVDIGVFAHNGVHYSAPAFVSLYFPPNQWREYGNDGNIRFVDYHGSPLSERYADPVLFPIRDWSDRYHYDEAGRLTGWTRTRAGGETRFTRHGARVIVSDNSGRPVQAAAIRYDLRPGPGGVRLVVEVPTGEILRYRYESASDQFGNPVRR